MKLLLISDRVTAREDPSRNLQHEFRDFLGDVLQDTDTIIQTVYFDELVFSINDDQFELYNSVNDQLITDVDCIFYRGPWLYRGSGCAYYVSQYCQWHNVPCINDYSVYYPGTKFAQNIVFAKQRAPILECLYAVQKNELVKHAESKFGYPYILKTNLGSHGDSNYLIESRQHATEILAREPEVDFLAQEYCPNDRDYRLLIVGSEQLVFERRGGSDTHLNNTSKGGAAARADDAMPVELAEKAREIMQVLGLTIAGVDVMPRLDTGEMYFLEINSQPQLRTGALLDEKKQILRSFFKSI